MSGKAARRVSAVSTPQALATARSTPTTNASDTSNSAVSWARSRSDAAASAKPKSTIHGRRQVQARPYDPSEGGAADRVEREMGTDIDPGDGHDPDPAPGDPAPAPAQIRTCGGGQGGGHCCVAGGEPSPAAAVQPPGRRAVGGQQGGADAVGAVSPRGHGRFRIGAPGAGDDLPFSGQHKTNTTPGSGKDQHGNNTDKTVLPGTRRHAC